MQDRDIGKAVRRVRRPGKGLGLAVVCGSFALLLAGGAASAMDVSSGKSAVPARAGKAAPPFAGVVKSPTARTRPLPWLFKLHPAAGAYLIPSSVRLSGAGGRFDRSLVVTSGSALRASKPAPRGSHADTRPRRGLAVANTTASTSSEQNPACTLAAGPGGAWLETCVYGNTGQTVRWPVPDGLTSPIVTVQVSGASGGDSSDRVPGGNGEYIHGDVSVAAGDALLLGVGGQGGDGVSPFTGFDPSNRQGGSGGWPNGGSGGYYVSAAGGGGGSSLVG